MRVSGMRLDERLEEASRLIVLPLSYLYRSEGVLVGNVPRLQTGGLRECGLRILEQIHLEADAAEAKQNHRIIGRQLLRPQPVRQRALEFAVALRHSSGKAQRV